MKTLIVLLLMSTTCFGQLGLDLGNFASDGSIGPAASTYETNAMLNIAQTTTGIDLTIPDPTNPSAGKAITINNTGTVPFNIIPGGVVNPNSGFLLRWVNPGQWSVTASGQIGISYSANMILSSPSGGSGYPSMRQLTITDLPLPAGVIEMYGGTSPPTGYLMCDGSAVSRITYDSLFTVIGVAFGVGDGSTTFNLPDLRQRFPIGKANSGTGSTLGATGGTIDHIHTVDPPNTTSGVPSNTVAATNLTGSAASTTHTHDINIAQFDSGIANPPFLTLYFIIKY